MLVISQHGPAGLVGSWALIAMVIIAYGFIEYMLGEPE